MIAEPFSLGPGRGKGEQLGTFLGVFTPSILTILGVILFLRAGWVVGNAGPAGAIVIVLIAHAITVATALSVSAVATNMKVGAGGAYFIISRSLGVEVGAAIGLPLFLAQALSATLYAFGLAESLEQVWPDVPQVPVAGATILAITLIAARGAGLALRLQVPIMAAIAVALVVLFFGVADQTGKAATAVIGVRESFWTVFAVFFPAVTGILAGISLSGDLKRPDRSIPRGTLAAVAVGLVVYLAVVIGLGVGADRQDLMTDNLIWFTLAGGAAFAIFPGLWGAIFSSAVGSILGAPRTLEAMVDDRVLPRWFGASIGGVKGPGMPLALSLAVSLGAVFLGDLDVVAPVLTMFFLTTYGMINLVAGVEALTADPSFRPTMRVPWFISLAGALGCFWVMYLINPIALFVALVIEIGIYLLMRRRALAAPWGDLRRGAIMSLIRSSVIQLRRLPLDPRNWRPNILLFAGDINRRPDLVRFGSWLVQDRGILTVCEMRVGTIDRDAGWLRSRTGELNEQLAELGVVAFGEVDIVEDFEQGAVAVAQANGIAGIESNTVMFGWSEKAHRQISQLRIIERLALLGKSAVISRSGGKRASEDASRDSCLVGRFAAERRHARPVCPPSLPQPGMARCADSHQEHRYVRDDAGAKHFSPERNDRICSTARRCRRVGETTRSLRFGRDQGAFCRGRRRPDGPESQRTRARGRVCGPSRADDGWASECAPGAQRRPFPGTLAGGPRGVEGGRSGMRQL